MKLLKRLFVMTSLAITPVLAAADYPNKEIEIVVNYGAGGVTDIATRLLAKSLEKQLEQPIVVINKPGGQATLGPAYLARQKPDGYTAGIITLSAVSITPHMVEVPYTVDDFDFIGGFGRFRYGLAVNADSPYHTVQEFLTAAKESEEGLFFGVPGAPNNLAFFQLASESGANLEQVLYKSGAESVGAVAAGQVDATIQTPSEIQPYIDSGRVRLLASVSPERWHDRPDMPTLRDEGYDVQIESWMGVALPSGAPEEIRTKLEKALKAAVEDPEFIEAFNNMGLDSAWQTGAQYKETLADSYREMRPLLEATGQPLISQD